MRRVKFVLMFVLLALLVACTGTFDLRVETTPVAEATLVALATENARLATQVATMTVPTPRPLPDLGRLAYIQGGDVWVKELPDGEPQRLTTDGRNREPRWSPSGQWLAFRKGDFQVWVMRTDGDDARPLNEGAAVESFAWAPVQDRLAYVAASDELRAINADGTDLVLLVPSTSAGRIDRIIWSPDGAWLAYEWWEQKANGPPDLWKIPASGGECVQLYPHGESEIGGPILVGWTGDGRFLLLQSDMNSASLLADGSPLYALPADGGSLVPLAQFVLAHLDFVVPEPAPTNRVAVVVGGFRGVWENKVLYIIQASSGEGVPLTSPDLAISSPAWSPGGGRIVYVAMPDLGDRQEAGGEAARQGLMQRRIWVTNADGSAPRPLTDDPAYRDEWPLWSADGSYIIFARLDSEDRASLWLVPAEGGEPLQVVGELTPAPDWFGYYGHINWGTLFDWWREPSGGEAAEAGGAGTKAWAGTS